MELREEQLAALRDGVDHQQTTLNLPARLSQSAIGQLRQQQAQLQSERLVCLGNAIDRREKALKTVLASRSLGEEHQVCLHWTDAEIKDMQQRLAQDVEELRVCEEICDSAPILPSRSGLSDRKRPMTSIWASATVVVREQEALAGKPLPRKPPSGQQVHATSGVVPARLCYSTYWEHWNNQNQHNKQESSWPGSISRQTTTTDWRGKTCSWRQKLNTPRFTSSGVITDGRGEARRYQNGPGSQRVSEQRQERPPQASKLELPTIISSTSVPDGRDTSKLGVRTAPGRASAAHL